jgi:hypothetical protein
MHVDRPGDNAKKFQDLQDQTVILNSKGGTTAATTSERRIVACIDKK